MAKEGAERGSGPGQISQVYRFRCRDCAQEFMAEAENGYLNIGRAQRWAREAGWSRGDGCWRCPSCAQARRKARKAEQKASSQA
jgi:hypothetical protein